MSTLHLTPAIALHASAALAATAIGPVALWARQGRAQRPRLHRAAGYAWVTLMAAAAISALFIPGTLGPRWGSLGPIHLFVPVTLGGLVLAFGCLLRGNIAGHRWVMQRLYLGACVAAGLFTLLPGRLLGQWLGTQLGWL